MNRSIIALTCGQALLALAGSLAIAMQPGASWIPHPLAIGAFAATLAVLSMLPRIYIEHDRHGSWITPSDAALIVGLFALGPIGFVAASVLAELLIALRFRQPALKTIFNLTTMFGGAVAGATTFALLARQDPLDPLAWLCALLALAAVTAWDLLAGAAVLAISENRPLVVILRRLGPAAIVSLLLSSALGLVALILYYETGAGILLFLPVLGILVASARAVAQQRAERHRFQQLYEASSKLTDLASLPAVLGKVAQQARGLVTGAAGLACAVQPDGRWVAVLVDDRGNHEAPDAMVTALLEIAHRQDRGETEAAALTSQQRHSLPPCETLDWASRPAEPAGRLVLAVARELPGDEQHDHRTDILSAYTAHAASVVANAQLHTDVTTALDHQLELNRQKSEFVASVSHELRTPLAGMIGSVQTIRRLEGHMPDADRRDLLDLGLSQGKRLQRLIEDLLIVAAADHQDVTCIQEQVDVTHLLAEIAAEVPAGLSARLEARFDAATLGNLTSDREKIRRILVNLLENAAKYAPEGPIELAARRLPNAVTISVRDHGPGIPPADRERVFERFVQLDQSSTRRQGGTGLGLHLSRELARLLGGNLTIDPAVTDGARLILELPASGDVATATNAAMAGVGGRSPLQRPTSNIRSRPATIQQTKAPEAAPAAGVKS